MHDFTVEQLLTKATRTYRRWCRRHGFAEDRPSASDSEVSDTHVTLRNCNGVLARYRIGRGGRLRMVETVAKEG